MIIHGGLSVSTELVAAHLPLMHHLSLFFKITALIFIEHQASVCLLRDRQFNFFGFTGLLVNHVEHLDFGVVLGECIWDLVCALQVCHVFAILSVFIVTLLVL